MAARSRTHPPSRLHPRLRSPGGTLRQDVSSSKGESERADQLATTRTHTLLPEDAPGLRLVGPGPVVALRVVGTEVELRLPLGQRTFTLGASSACDLVIPRTVSRKVSALHATVGRLADGRLVVADQGSKNGTFPAAGAPRATAFEVTVGQRFEVGDVALLAVDDHLQQLRRPAAWTLGLAATAAVDAALEVIAHDLPLALVGPPGTDALALARQIHATSAHRQHFCLELVQPGTAPALEHAVGGTVIIDLAAVGKVTKRTVEAVLDRDREGPRRGLRAIFLATSTRQLVGALDVLRDEVEAVAVPALAARGADVPALLAHVWLHELETRRRVEELGSAAVAALQTAAWPRNLDSLREVAPRLLALVEHGSVRAAAAALGMSRQALANALARVGVIA